MIKIYYKSMKEGNIYQKWDGGKENRPIFPVPFPPSKFVIKNFYHHTINQLKLKGKCELEIQSNSLEGLLKNEDIYQLKVGQMCVEMSYTDNNKSFSECMLNILKQKVKIDDIYQ